MSVTIRAAEIKDIDCITDLLLLDAKQRQNADSVIWKLAPNPREKTASTIKSAMTNEKPPFRQQWLLAEFDGQIVGLSHSILLPVPPIYAGEFGAPGLVMEDCFVIPDAPSGTSDALLAAAEADLVGAGAKILLGSSIAGGTWETTYHAADYAPLTLYLAKIDLEASEPLEGIRKANTQDVPAIVSSSAQNRDILFDLNTFWKPHPEADARFGNWMNTSLTLTDRDMFVSEVEGEITGYAISQPATPLHLPTPHQITGIGILDDVFHADFANPEALWGDGYSAQNLLKSAEAALQGRGNSATLIVCPAAWSSKITLLEGLGYRNAITWYKKRGSVS